MGEEDIVDSPRFIAAVMAMQGILASQPMNIAYDVEWVALRARVSADALIAELAK